METVIGDLSRLIVVADSQMGTMMGALFILAEAHLLVMVLDSDQQRFPIKFVAQLVIKLKLLLEKEAESNFALGISSVTPLYRSVRMSQREAIVGTSRVTIGNAQVAALRTYCPRKGQEGVLKVGVKVHPYKNTFRIRGRSSISSHNIQWGWFDLLCYNRKSKI